MGKSARLFGVTALVSTGLFVALFAGLTPSASTTEDAYVDRKVNLALRRTVHHLLRKAGDSTSRIAPVLRPDAHTFVVRLEHSFDYSQLPALLQESFRIHEIRANYDVAVLDCTHSELLLGYNARDLAGQTGVPCRGRQQENTCYNLQVTLNRPEPASALPPMGWLLAVSALLIGVVYLVRKRPVAPNVVTTPAGPIQPDLRLIYFGRSSLNSVTHALQSGTKQASLTYREAKLLRFFIDHTNQIVERDRILKAVWEDEGITVDRSVDVFVSRLRKLLQDDPTIRLVAVYGVGYRLEIQ